MNSGAVQKDGRLPGYLEYIVNGLKGTEYADTHVYGLWGKQTLEKYPYTFQDKKMIELEDEIADAKYSLVYSIVPNFITIKPYEMIIKGLVPFIHPDYDRNRILELPEYLYVNSPEEFVSKMTELDANPDMVIFLEEYSPEEKHITSLKEIRLIEDKLNIDNYRNNLRALRNSVVQFYDDLIDEDPNNRDMTYAYMESMMSVTAVIDNYAYKF